MLGDLRLAGVCTLLAASCSLINKPADPITGGAGGSGGGSACVEPFDTLTNCGQCGVACAPKNVKTPSCDTGKCKYDSCAGAFLDCDANQANGCEIDGSSDAQNCGGCGNACAKAGIANAALVCAAGKCDYSKCDPLWGDCDGNRANGCEKPTNTLADCGMCGMPCNPQNVNMPTCADGSCKFDMCTGTFQDCDGNAANGCESDKQSDKDHCGDCMTKCGANETCFAGKCGAVGKSCKDILDLKASTGDGKYLVSPDGDFKNAFPVLCDMTTDGGGWTLLTWTLNSAQQPLGVPYPGVAPCPTLDCPRGSVAAPPAPQKLLAISKELGQAQTPGSLAKIGSMQAFQYAGKFVYPSLANITLNYGPTNCMPGVTGTFSTLIGPNTFNGKPVFLGQALAYASYNYASDANQYIWNVGAPNMYCDGTGQMPGSWMGTWSPSQYGPFMPSQQGAYAVWVR